MSDKLVINPHPASLNCSGHPPIWSLRMGIHSRRPCVLQGRRCRVLFSAPESIRSSSFRGMNIYKPKDSLRYLSCQPMGGFEPDLNGFLNQKQSASTVGRVKPQLNGFLYQPVGVEFELNCSRIIVNQEKILFQSQEVPPQNPATKIKIDLQKILIGFGGGARRAEGWYHSILIRSGRGLP